MDTIEFPDDILFHMCDITDISYTKYLRLISKSIKDYVNCKYKMYKIYKMTSFINGHFSCEHLNIMHITGLIAHTNKLKSKIQMDKKLLLNNISLIKNKHLCTYVTQYSSIIQVTTHSVILNLL